MSIGPEPVRRLLAVALSATLGPLGSCGSKVTPVTAAPSTEKAARGSSGSSGSETADEGSFGQTSGDTEGPSGSESADPPSDGGVGALLASCGVTEKELSDPTSVLFEKDFTSWPKVFHGNFNAIVVAGEYVVSVKTKIHIKATLGETRQSTDFLVTGQPDKAVAQAQATAAPNKGTTITKSVSSEERTKLGSTNKEWEGILCTIGGTKEVVIDKGGTNRVYSFNPPLPSAVSPRASADRFKTEIGAGRTFTKIELTVESSTDPKTPKGTKIMGTVKITPLTPKLTLQIGAAGKETVVQTEVAFKIETDFGGPKATAALGILPMTAMYISTTKKDLRIIVGDTGDPDLGMIVLSDELQ